MIKTSLKKTKRRGTGRARIQRVAILHHSDHKGVKKALDPTIRKLRNRGATVEVFDVNQAPEFSSLSPKSRPHLLISVGGDGTILAAARAIAGTPIPLLPINRGGLGFLASAEIREIGQILDLALAGELKRESHPLIRVRLLAKTGRKRTLGIAVNDAVLRQGDSLRALRAELALDGEPLGTLLADGLIVATALGSTAYSLSAGGPLLIGQVPALVATPVCPHTLQSRPLVFSGDRHLTARLFARVSDVTLSLDGLPGINIANGETVEFTLDQKKVFFLRMPGRDSLHPLRMKLNWHGTDLIRSP